MRATSLTSSGHTALCSTSATAAVQVHATAHPSKSLAHSYSEASLRGSGACSCFPETTGLLSWSAARPGIECASLTDGMDLQQRMGVNWESLGVAVREVRVQPVESYATQALAAGDSNYRVVQRALDEYVFKQVRSLNT